MTTKESRFPADHFKDWVKRSGFPFENEVLTTFLRKKQVLIRPEQRFVSVAPGNAVNLRSIDFQAEFSFHVRLNASSSDPDQRLELTFIGDSKWHSSDAYWFTPSRGLRTAEPVSLIPDESPAYSGYESTIRIKLPEILLDLYADVPVASRGSRVSEKEDRRQSLYSSVCQVLDGLINSMSRDMKRLGTPKPSRHMDLDGTLYVPLMVTNASLFLLKDGVTCAQVDKASSIKEIGQEVPYLAMETPSDFSLVSKAYKLEREIELFRPEAAPAKDHRWVVRNLGFPYTFVVNGNHLEEFISRHLDFLGKLPHAKLAKPLDRVRLAAMQRKKSF